jgi:hypothetical protein
MYLLLVHAGSKSLVHMYLLLVHAGSIPDNKNYETATTKNCTALMSKQYETINTTMRTGLASV